ncbi:uncharacterized protein LOC117642271 isoform X2 [Thrips palmi]|uniref:Uncharacterized protein LOC117642271 isoform X2 n=1 Tax=Thrips palmi TaxID=161013 RepID=A0A6P8YGV8_THRPL|nr:uncharacterized protein LOC117642271 isoform X2 [Thrips palmi]
MHSISEFGANVPAFLAKLWKLVDDPETNELISWTEEGTSFFIRDQAQFSRKLLPMYYKHNNMASFIRQLNMYGFHKIVSADAGSLRLDKDEMEFAHQFFMRGHPYLLEHIKRKVGKSQLLTSKQIDESKDGNNGGVVVKAEFMNNVLSEVKMMRGRQEAVENRLTTMKQQNEALWRELSVLRQKHLKQQNILISFLVQLVQPNQRISKRKFAPLMINDVYPPHPNGQDSGKVTNLRGPLIMSLRASQSNMSRSSSGPTIHELDDSLLPDTDTLHLPDTELEMDGSMEPEVLSPNPEVLENLDPSIIPLITSPSSVTSTEVNLAEGLPLGETLKASSPSPEFLAAAPPNELSPAIVPALLVSKGKAPAPLQSQPQKILTRSSSASSSSSSGPGPSKSNVMTRKSAANAAKSTTPSKMGAQVHGVKTLGGEQAATAKRELRVLPPRNRRKKSTNGKEMLLTPKNELIDNIVESEDLLAEVGLTNPSLSPTTSSLNQNNDPTHGSLNGSIHSPDPSQHLAFPLPESPIPIINSPVSSPASQCNMISSMPSLSPVSGTTITDVTSPMVVQQPDNTASSEQQMSESSPVGLNLPYDMTLACTSQAGSSPGNYVTVKSPSFNRCEINGKDDLDLHVGTIESDLGTLKELFNNSGMQLDANTLLGLFGDQILSDPEETNLNSKMDTSGNEIMYYQPDFMDLEDIWNTENIRSTPPPSPVNILSSELNTPVMTPASPGFFPANKRRRN